MIEIIKDFSEWKYYIDPITNENKGIFIDYGNGTIESKNLKDPEVATWLEKGNTPLPADK